MNTKFWWDYGVVCGKRFVSAASEMLLPPRGIEQLATAIDCNNWQSIDAHRSLGFQTDGILCCLRVFGLTIRAYKPSPGRWRPVRARLELARA